MKPGKYSIGIGDRFAHQGVYQLEAIREAGGLGVEITPVWNKSFREHKIAGSGPESVREEADGSTRQLKWDKPYFVDADHITMDTVDEFISSSDFFTIDVADKIGLGLEPKELRSFVHDYRIYQGKLEIPGMGTPLEVSEDILAGIGNKFYKAAREAGRIYRRIQKLKADKPFVVEVSMDEVQKPQSPVDLFFILLLLAENNVPPDTIAPKFTGRFNKGVDYQGDTDLFAKEFEEDLMIIRHCVSKFGLPEGLKLSIHTGSDKFSLYPVINKIMKKHNAGVHLKTAGTTWLEEYIGLAESGGSGLDMAKSIYIEALQRFDELTGPYREVLTIDPERLPSEEEFNIWGGVKLAGVVRHNPSNPEYNPHLRQLLHTAYKIAAEKGDLFLAELRKNKEIIGKNVKTNILDRHIKPLFIN